MKESLHRRLAWFSLDVRATVVALLLLLLVPLAVAGCQSAPKPILTPTRTPRPRLTPTNTRTPAPVATPTLAATATPTPNPYANPLTGQRVSDPALLQRRPIHVRLGNDAEIRPQSGLSQADLVYEEMMEGAGTRLTAVFLAQDPEAIGPVRSARLVNLELTPQFDAALVHSGASDHTRWLISQSKIVDLDEFFNPAPYYYIEGRDWRGRLFTSALHLREYLVKRGWEKKVTLQGFVFSPEGAPPPGGTPAQSIAIPYSGGSSVEWQYDSLAGVYRRLVAGKPQVDAGNKQSLTAANVVVIYARHEDTDIVEDSLGATAIRIVLSGEGKAVVCRDGVAVTGRWQRNAPEQLMRFVDATGQPIPFKPGVTWFQIVPLDFAVTVK
ncbi:MAG: DUF3048 domain-containing protein [Chloroflexi bacterium]|nr:DUF3048 domain-containing protein [Chloroflexota bacterium]